MVDVDRQPDRRSLQAGERADDGGRCGRAIELPARATRDDLRRAAVQDDGRVAGRHVHCGGDLVQLVPERRVVDLGRRRDVGAEEAHVEPPEPAQRTEPLALPANRIHRSAPVHADAKAPRL